MSSGEGEMGQKWRENIPKPVRKLEALDIVRGLQVCDGGVWARKKKYGGSWLPKFAKNTNLGTAPGSVLISDLSPAIRTPLNMIS
jgi:hypothetical protein